MSANKENMKASLQLMASLLDTAIRDERPNTVRELETILKRFLVGISPLNRYIQYEVKDVKYYGCPQGVKVKLTYSREQITTQRTIPPREVYCIHS